MPGFDLKRFTEPEAAAELKEFCCFICQDIFCNPMVTPCCHQTSCEECIKTWIDANKTCPTDHKPLTVDQLLKPPTIISKILNGKKIKCAFEPQGCKEVLLVEGVLNHEKVCLFDKEQCPSCGSVKTNDHDCLKSLLEFKQGITATIDSVHKDIDEGHVQKKNLSAQIENFTKTIQDLLHEKAPAGEPPIKPGGAVRVSSNKEMLVEAKKYVDTPVVDPHKTNKEIVNKAVEWAKEGVNNKEKIYEVARHVKDSMDNNFIGDWNVYIVYNNIGFVFHNVIPEGFIEVKFGKVVVTIYRTFDTLGFARLVSFVKAGVIKDFVVSKSGYEEAATREIEKVVLHCLKSAKTDMNEFTDKVSTQLIKKYSGTWHCFLYKANFAFYCVRSDKGRFCLLSTSDVKILVFQ